MARYLKKNKQTANAKALERAKRSIVWQAGLAGITILLTVVILFAMTSAWYTNIVQTSGLTFQAESWGFDGSITVSEASIKAAPGDEGEIYLEVVNNSESISAVSVAVSKARIEETEMRKRLFFYVDTPMTREGERMERVYLNTIESYTYTLFGKDKLTLTEEVHSDAPLKWQWVYDMLGYYVLGSWDDNQERFTEAEYLRPIEYNYDDATYQEVEDPDTEEKTYQMLTVDGETTMEEFLIELSKTDGYKGQIKKDSGHDGYYPVDVDESGYGVYAYLCSYTDIYLATLYDTRLGENAANSENNVDGATPSPACPVQLTISAQKNDENIIPVDTLASLYTAMELDSSFTLKLSGDLAVSDTAPLVIPKDKNLVLDMNGHTIVSSSADRAVHVQSGGSLTLLNGGIKAADGVNATYGVYATGAEVTFNDVDISGFGYAVYVRDDVENNTLDSKVRLVNCDVNGGDAAIVVSGNGTASQRDTQLIIDHCNLYGTYYALAGNGNTAGVGRWGTDVQVIESILQSQTGDESAAIYHPQKDSSLTLYKSTVSGHTGMIIKGGEVTVVDSEIRGEAETTQAPKFEGSGATATGDAIYVETGYKYDIALTIKGESKLYSKNGHALQVFEEDQPFVSITVYSTQINSSQTLIPPKYLAEGSQYEGNTTHVVAAEAEE